MKKKPAQKILILPIVLVALVVSITIIIASNTQNYTEQGSLETTENNFDDLITQVNSATEKFMANHNMTFENEIVEIMEANEIVKLFYRDVSMMALPSDNRVYGTHSDATGLEEGIGYMHLFNHSMDFTHENDLGKFQGTLNLESVEFIEEVDGFNFYILIYEGYIFPNN